MKHTKGQGDATLRSGPLDYRGTNAPQFFDLIAKGFIIILLISKIDFAYNAKNLLLPPFWGSGSPLFWCAPQDNFSLQMRGRRREGRFLCSSSIQNYRLEVANLHFAMFGCWNCLGGAL